MTVGAADECCSNLQRSLLDLPRCVVDKQLELLVSSDLQSGVKLCTSSKQLRDQLAEVLQRLPDVKEKVQAARNTHQQRCLKEATSCMALSDPSTGVVLWISALLIALIGIRSPDEWRALELYQWLVHAYSLSLFSRMWPTRTAREVLLIFDFSLSLAGNIFCTLLASVLRNRFSSTCALLSLVHALVMSVVLLSVSVQPSSWRLGSTMLRIHNRLAVVMYFSLAFYHDGFSGAWRLASASCRLFTLVYMSWLAVIPK